VRTRIKFCGMTRAADVAAAVDAGADALGFIFADGSPRCIDLARLDALLAVLPPLVTPVALFRDNPSAEVAAVLARSPRLIAQFHGDEPPTFCAGFSRAWLKAVPMGAIDDGALPAFLSAQAAAGCIGFVFDSHGGARAGGSGSSFDWSRLPKRVPAPLILAGGLTPDNVAAAIRVVRPFAVDVSSGIESAPGHKDHAKMQRFADEVRRAGTD
jgi:phosphoribosylanthranilate isomerase